MYREFQNDQTKLLQKFEGIKIKTFETVTLGSLMCTYGNCMNINKRNENIIVENKEDRGSS